MQILAILATILVVFAFFPRYESSEERAFKSFKKQIGLDKKGAVILISVYPQSGQARRSIWDLETYLQKYDWDINLVVKSLTGKPFPVGDPGTLLLGPEIELPLGAQEFQVLHHSKVPIFKGSIAHGTSILKDFLYRTFSGELGFVLEDYLPAGRRIDDTVFAAGIGNQYGEKSQTVFVFFEDICFSCSSGITLGRIEDLQQSYPETQFVYITMGSYSSEQLSNFIENYHIRIPIQLPNREFVAFWKSLNREEFHNHPLEGLILAVNAIGEVEFKGKSHKIKALANWLQSRGKPKNSKTI